MVDLVSRSKLALFASAALAGLAFAGLASAQAMNTNSANYNAGYGRSVDQENQPVDVSVRDADGNLVVLDGVTQAGQDQSGFSNSGAGGAFDTASGVSTSSDASAVSTNLVVVIRGDRNTVNSSQTNNGNVSGSTSLNGGVSNDH